MGAAAVSTGSDSLTVFIFVIGILLAVVGTLTGVIVGFIYRKINENSRHVQSLAQNYFGMMWRVRDIEKDLAKRHQYVPMSIQERDLERDADW